MPRHALRRFFRRALPLAALLESGCPFVGSCPTDIRTRQVVAELDGGLPDALGPVACNELCIGSGLSGATCEPGAKVDGGQLVTCHGQVQCIGGRRPAALAEARVEGASEVGRFFARLAHLEGASVPAFERLAVELRAHRAPAHLVRAARAAARDEIRHARVTAKLARRFGGVVPQVRVAPLPLRALDEIAVENAAEGCVRETWGAALARLQAACSSDPVVKKAMHAIARDEERHAELAFEVDAWARRRLDRVARMRVEAAREAAVAELERELDPWLRLLFDEARATLWS